MNRKMILGAVLAAASVTTAAHAEDAPGVEPAEKAADGLDMEHSVNVSPLGLLVGSYAVNYELLLDGYHGFIAEGIFSSSSTDDADSVAGGALVGYRWHWSGEQDSGFVGANLSYQVGSGTAKVTVDGTETASFDVDTTSLAVTANIGRRWAWDSGFNITLRIGAGYGLHDVSTDSDDELAQDAVKLVDDLLTLIPVAIDGELSIGWIF